MLAPATVTDALCIAKARIPVTGREWKRCMEYEAILFDLFGTLVDDAGRAIDGAAELLGRLQGQRYALVTSCSRALAVGLLRHASLPEFEVLVCADDVAANKPAPDGYLAAAKRFELQPERCLVVEDSPQGIHAGRAAGMDVVAILRGRERSFAVSATATFLTLARFAEALQIGADGVLRL